MAFAIESGIHISLNGTTWYKLTDHNRGEIEIVPELIEKSARMANGTLRKYVVAKKMRISTSWERVPSDSAYTVDQNRSAEWLEAFYNANVGLPIKLKITSATGVVPSPGVAPTDGVPVESKIYDVFITDFSKTIVWRTKFADSSVPGSTSRRRDFVNMNIEFTEI